MHGRRFPPRHCVGVGRDNLVRQRRYRWQSARAYDVQLSELSGLNGEFAEVADTVEVLEAVLNARGLSLAKANPGTQTPILVCTGDVTMFNPLLVQTG